MIFENNDPKVAVPHKDLTSVVLQRANELGEFVAGNMQFSVSNADNRFNPSNTSSPYYDSSAGKSKIQPL